MAPAKARSESRSLYERDLNLWVEEQVALLESGAFERLDVANLIEEIADMARSQKKAIRSNLVILLTHLLEWHYQPERRSTSRASSIVEHRRRIQDEIDDSPSLAGYRARSSSDAIVMPVPRRRPIRACR
jgi:hypothetical protein